MRSTRPRRVAAILVSAAFASPLWAQEAASSTTVERTTPAWVATSNRYANALLETEAQFNPESVSERGLAQFDGLAADLGPDVDQRRRAALVKAKADLQAGLARERDPNVRQDLQIMIEAVDRRIEGIDLSRKYERDWTDAALRVFRGEQALLQEQIAAARRPKALERLQRYVGLWPQSTSIFDQARARYEESKGAGKLEPTRLEVEQAIANAATYVDGVRKLYQKYPQPDSDAALAAFEQQAKAYTEWLRAEVLPVSRTDPKLPPELYAYNLRQVGIDIAPELLIQRAQAAFMETRAAMQQLAPLVAKEKGLGGIPQGAYPLVIRALKKDKIPNDQLEAEYRKVIDAIDPIIRREKIVDVPARPMIMRLGTPAESAAQPAPHFRGAQLIGNTGEQGQFVLPLGNPAAGKDAMYDDFNYPSAAWTLSAHEGHGIANSDQNSPLGLSLMWSCTCSVRPSRTTFRTSPKRPFAADASRSAAETSGSSANCSPACWRPKLADSIVTCTCAWTRRPGKGPGRMVSNSNRPAGSVRTQPRRRQGRPGRSLYTPESSV